MIIGQFKLGIDNVHVISHWRRVGEIGNYLAKQKKVKEHERQIDGMVYKLYGLAPEEIKIVDIMKLPDKAIQRI